MDTKLLVRNGRDPFELLFLVAALLVGIAGLLFDASSPNLRSALPGSLLMWWQAGLISGALISLYGISYPPPVSLLIERTGLLLLAGLCGAYAVAIIVNAAEGLATGLFVGFAFSGASLLRSIQITRDLKRVKVWVKEIGGDQ